MADLIAIGYNDTTTAEQALNEVAKLSRDLIIQPDAAAAIIRDPDGKIRTVTNQNEVKMGTASGAFWGFLFGLLFFIPVIGMAVGAGLGALMGKMGKTAIDRSFQEQVRDMLKPGTSALFMIVEQMTTDKALDALSKYGGTVIKSSLSEQDQAEMQKALSGQMAGTSTR